jgi:hypothetical protein
MLTACIPGTSEARIGRVPVSASDGPADRPTSCPYRRGSDRPQRRRPSGCGARGRGSRSASHGLCRFRVHRRLGGRRAAAVGAAVVDLDLSIPSPPRAPATKAGAAPRRTGRSITCSSSTAIARCNRAGSTLHEAFLDENPQSPWSMAVGASAIPRPVSTTSSATGNGTGRRGGEVLRRGCDDAGGGAAGRWAATIRSLIAGEEPELCVRLRAAGWQIWCLDAEMTLHDAAMTRFGQFWKRARRAGHAYAEGAAMHGAPPERHGVAGRNRALLWGAALPVAILLLALIHPALPASGAGLSRTGGAHRPETQGAAR